jgi:hypothetical protein
MENALANSYLNESNKMDGSNYVNWKFNIKTLMETSNVWPVVSGQEAKFEAPANTRDWDTRERK